MKKKSVCKRLLLIAMLLLGVALILYPILGNFLNSLNQSRVIDDYDDRTVSYDDGEYTEMLEQARAYNASLADTSHTFESGREVYPYVYEDILDVNDSGVMCYVSIPKISVTIPVYHGTSDKVLSSAAGHLKGTSFPVGGENTHAVISAHRGLPTAKLFTDIDRLEVGDVFTITVLNEVLTYRVDKISVVKPYDTSEIGIIDGRDLVTLQTCTPYGVNSQRLLARGSRIDNAEEDLISAGENCRCIFNILWVFIFVLLILICVKIYLLIRRRVIKQKLKRYGSGMNADS